MKPPRLLVIGHSYGLAVNRAIIREVGRMAPFEITVAAPSFFHGDLRPIYCEPEPPDSPLKIVSLPARWTSHIHVYNYHRGPLRRLLLENGFQAIHAWEEPYIFAGYQIARLAAESGARFCFRSAQSLSKTYPPPFGYFEKQTLRAAHRWIAGGRSVFDNLVSRGYPADRGRILTLAVDTDAFKPAEEEARQLVRESLGLTPPVIGFLGRLVPAKGLRILMEALERLNPEVPWSLLLLGSGEMQSEIQQWANQRGWQQRVKIHLAKHDEVPRYLAAMDILAAPSQTARNWKEQFGRMLIEAFACGVTVVASDSGEIPFVVGDSGFIVPENDVAAWSATLERLLRDSKLRIEMGAKGRAHVERYSARTIARQYVDFYQELFDSAK